MDSDSTTLTSNQEQRARVEAHVVSSNAVLSDTDQDVLRELLLEARKGPNGLDAEISAKEVEIMKMKAAMEAALGALKRRRAKEAERIKKLQGGITARKRLPPELLALIFVHYINYVFVDVPPGRNSLDRSWSPWTLCQVCSRWRKIALAEPRLWKRIRVLPGDPWQRRATMEVLHDIFSHRGGDGKVELILWVRSQDDWEALLSLMPLYSSRIRNLTIIGSPSPYLLTPMKAFESLEEFVLMGDLDMFGDPDESPITALSLSHNLRKVQILPTDIDYANPTPSSSWHSRFLLPWTQLTDIALTAISPSTCLGVLVHCGQLLDFTVTFSPDAIHHPFPSTLISLPHLHSISIKMSQISQIFWTHYFFRHYRR